MSVTLQTMYDEMRSTWQNMQEVIDVQEKEIKSFGETSAETKQHIDRLNDRISQVETMMARPQFASMNAQTEAKPAASAAKSAYIQALYKGYSSLTPEQKQMVQIVSPAEVKVLQQVDETGGGYASVFSFYEKKVTIEALAA